MFDLVEDIEKKTIKTTVFYFRREIQEKHRKFIYFNTDVYLFLVFFLL